MRYGIGEIIDFVRKAETEDEKVEILKKWDSNRFRELLFNTYSPSVKFDLNVDELSPYRESDALIGEGDARLSVEVRKLYLFTEGHPNKAVDPKKREKLVLTLLESLDKQEAELLLEVFKKSIAGVPVEVVSKAFPDLIK